VRSGEGPSSRDPSAPTDARNATPSAASLFAASATSASKWFPIVTERLTLREFRNADEADIHEYGGDPEVSTFTDWGPNTPAQTRQVLQERLDAQHGWPRREVALAIELLAERKVIGSIDLTIDDRLPRTASFGYVLNRNHWNRGYTSEAARAILRVAFDDLKMHRVWATCDARNVASWRVMEKLGMRREAEFRDDVLQKGAWRDSYLYAILADEFVAELPPRNGNRPGRLFNERLYETRAADFAAHSESSKYNEFYERPAMLNALGDPRGKSILDVGCGAAPLLRRLQGRGARRLVGIEASRGLVELARAGTTGEVTIYQGDAEEVLAQLAGSNFDCVVSSLVIHYINPLEPLFRRVVGALAPGGRFLISTNIPATESSSEPVYEWWPKLGIEVARFDQSESLLRDSLRDAGFEHVEITEILPSSELRELAPDTYERLSATPEFVLIEATL
jgi:[ribosomal protein S5]-alanine N-acetyltransferase